MMVELKKGRNLVSVSRNSLKSYSGLLNINPKSSIIILAQVVIKMSCRKGFSIVILI